jgi:four helix bundle protein
VIRQVKTINEPLESYNQRKDFTTLKCWEEARKLKLFIYKEIFPEIPKSESYNLISQMKRAAISGTANIAEGYGRYHFQESIQFYRIARASVYELKDHLISCHDLSFISDDVFHKGLNQIEKTKITINGFINYIQKEKSIH